MYIYTYVRTYIHIYTYTHVHICIYNNVVFEYATMYIVQSSLSWDLTLGSSGSLSRQCNSAWNLVVGLLMPVPPTCSTTKPKP